MLWWLLGTTEALTTSLALKRPSSTLLIDATVAHLSPHWHLKSRTMHAGSRVHTDQVLMSLLPLADRETTFVYT